MKYTPTYFDFDKLKHTESIAEMLLMVVVVYILIYSVAWVLSKLPPK